VLPVIYFATILGQLPTTAVTEIDYQRPLLTAVGAAIAMGIGGGIAISVASPKEAGKSDQRDKDVSRFGEFVGGMILAVGMVVPFGLAIAEVPHFWIANAIYLVFVLSAICGTTVKLVAYRRGL
jgi:hypothetical protein